MRTILKSLLVTGALASTAMPAHSAAALRTEVDYFHCSPSQSTPIGNVNIVADGEKPTWDENAPEASVADGAGCSFANVMVAGGAGYETIYDALFGGTFTGNLDSMTIRAYLTGLRSLAVGQPITITVHLGVDGKSMFGASTSTTGDPSPGDKGVKVVPTFTDSGLGVVEFTITGIQFTAEDGVGSAEHEVALTLNASSEPLNLFVMDTTEAPSGLTFNPAAPAAVTLEATTPGPDAA